MFGADTVPEGLQIRNLTFAFRNSPLGSELRPHRFGL